MPNPIQLSSALDLVTVVLVFRDTSDSASVALLWEVNGAAAVVVPASQLFVLPGLRLNSVAIGCGS